MHFKTISTYFAVCCCQDVALLDKLIKEDIEAGKLPLLLIANAGEIVLLKYMISSVNSHLLIPSPACGLTWAFFFFPRYPWGRTHRQVGSSQGSV